MVQQLVGTNRAPRAGQQQGVTVQRASSFTHVSRVTIPARLLLQRRSHVTLTHSSQAEHEDMFVILDPQRFLGSLTW